MMRRLAEADPSNAGWQRDLSINLMRMAELREGTGDRAAALALAEESLAIGKRLAALDKSSVTWQKDVAFGRALVTRLGGERAADQTETGARPGGRARARAPAPRRSHLGITSGRRR